MSVSDAKLKNPVEEAKNRGDAPVTATGPHCFGWFEASVYSRTLASAERLSLTAGVIGVLIANAICLLLFVVAIWAADSLLSTRLSGEHGFTYLISGIVMVPAAAAMGNGIFLPLFMTYSLAMRCLLAAAILLPTTICFVTASHASGLLIDGSNLINDLGLIFSFVIGVALATGLFRQFSGRSLTPWVGEARPVDRLSIRTLLQWMVVVAGLCGIVRYLTLSGAIDLTRQTWLPMLLGMSLGGVQSVTSLATFSRQRVWYGMQFVAYALSVHSIYFVSIYVGSIEYRTTFRDLHSTGLLHGITLGAMFLVVVLLQLYWLRGCGWAMVRSRDVAGQGRDVR